MQRLLDAHGVVLAHGPRVLVHDAALSLHAGDRLALVGPNGSGKSSLLRALAGAPTVGTVDRAAGVRVGLLPQVVPRTGTVRDLLLARCGVAAAAVELDAQAARLQDGDLDAVQPHADALDAWLALGGADVEARIPGALTGAGLDPAWVDRSLAGLSGGECARAGLAALALARHDVLLLDEPTNHLDRDGLRALIRLVRGAPGAVVLVSHDRAFLAATATRVASLEQGRLVVQQGGWDVFERERSRARERALREHERAVAERDRLRAAEAARRASAVRGERRARVSPRDGDKAIRHLNIESAQNARGAFSRRSEQVVVPEKPFAGTASHLLLEAADTLRPVALVGAVVRAGSFHLGPVDLTVRPGERVGLSGPNGSGKSTLIGALAGRVPLVAGDRSGGATVELAQEDGPLAHDPQRQLVTALREEGDLGERAARAALAAVGLDADVVVRPVGTLSPGERTRAELALLAHRGAGCLLLDEPTNHLDVDALEVLEAALRGWRGGLVVATHDERFRAALALDREVCLREVSERGGRPS